MGWLLFNYSVCLFCGCQHSYASDIVSLCVRSSVNHSLLSSYEISLNSIINIS
jgi:hypothetical protein